MKLTIDAVTPDRFTGFWDGAGDCPVSGSRDGSHYVLYGGVSDEYRGSGSSLVIAARRLAKSIDPNATGVIEIDRDYRPGAKTHQI